jgi:glycosyltransferase involved in cell wall biosynthesis
VRVLRIIARLNVGGPARHVTWLNAGLEDAGYETCLIVGKVPEGESDMTQFALKHGVKPVVIEQMSREISPKDIVTIWKIFRFILKTKPDIIHTHTAKAGTVGRVAGLLYKLLTPSILFGRPKRCFLVHTYHGHIFHSYYGKLKTGIFLLIERLLARFATDRIITISPQQFQEIHSNFKVGRPEQFRVIRLGLDLEGFSTWKEKRRLLREELGFGEDDLLIGIVGRLTAVKNHRMFFHAASLFKRDHTTGLKSRVKFLIIGDGELREELQAYAQSLGITEFVTFLGLREDPELFYPFLDIVALTSLNEGTPLTLIEAMANGRPVVATAVGGVVDLVTDSFNPDQLSGHKTYERGILVAPKDPRSFSDALHILAEDKDLQTRLGSAGEEFVKKIYTRQRLIADIIELYDDLASNERVLGQDKLPDVSQMNTSE